MAHKTVRCCGISFRDSPTTLLQVVLVKLPLVYVLTVIEAVTWSIRRIAGRAGRPRVLGALFQSQVAQIREASLAPRLRCVLATKFFHLSPRVSGLVFRAFNFAALTLCLGAVAGVVMLVMAWRPF